MSWHLSLQIWSHDSGQWMPCFDNWQSPIRWMSFIKLIELRLQLPILARKMWKCEISHWLPCAADGWLGRWTGGWTDLRSLDYQNFSDGYITKFSCPLKSNLLFAFLSGRSEETLERVEAYMKATKMFRDFSDPNNDPVFSEVRQKLWGFCPALASKSF